MVKNVIEDVLTPETPAVIPNEHIQVYIPVASSEQVGLAKFYNEHFIVIDGRVSIRKDYLTGLYDSLYQRKIDDGLKTNDKSIVGAINELNNYSDVVKLASETAVSASGSAITSKQLAIQAEVAAKQHRDDAETYTRQALTYKNDAASSKIATNEDRTYVSSAKTTIEQYKADAANAASKAEAALAELVGNKAIYFESSFIDLLRTMEQSSANGTPFYKYNSIVVLAEKGIPDVWVNDFSPTSSIEYDDISSEDFEAGTVDVTPGSIFKVKNTDYFIVALESGNVIDNASIYPEISTIIKRDILGIAYSENTEFSTDGELLAYLGAKELINASTLYAYAQRKLDAPGGDSCVYAFDNQGRPELRFITEGADDLFAHGDRLVKAEDLTSYVLTALNNLEDLYAGKKALDDLIIVANEALSIAKGANQAKAFYSYEHVVAILNAAESSTYNVGQNIYVAPLDTPDLWIYDNYPDKEVYSYTTEEAFKQDLETNKFVRIGHYALAVLETQKVDLTEYYTKEYIDEALAKKVTAASGSKWIVYGYNGDSKTQTTVGLDYASAANVNNIPRRGSNGAILIPDKSITDSGTITDGQQAVNKKYVDDKIANVSGMGAEVEFTGGILTVENNKTYVGRDIYTLAINYPEGNFECYLQFTITARDNYVYISFPSTSKFIGDPPIFGDGETWEISIKNGVVVGGKVE